MDDASVKLPESGIWPRLLGIIDQNPGTVGLRHHGLAPLAVAHWTGQGRTVPPELHSDRAAQAAAGMEAGELLRALRSSTSGPILLIKGLEVAARYPDTTL